MPRKSEAPAVSDDGLVETLRDSESVFSGKLLKVRRDNVSLPDGKPAIREYITHPGAVVIIAVLPDGRLVFERQYRYPLRRAFLELPAGKIDPGEEIAATAVRELREEAGYVAGCWRYLGVFHPCIGYSDERIEIFLAEDLSEVGAELDDGEFLEVLALTLDEALESVRSGRITDGKTIAALFWAEKVLRQGW